MAIEDDIPETNLMKRADSELVRNAIDDLPMRHREILLLCEVEEMSYQEIAETLSIPIGTVMSRLSRGGKKQGALRRGGRPPPRRRSRSRRS